VLSQKTDKSAYPYEEIASGINAFGLKGRALTGLIVHEWMEKNGGAEKVVKSMLSAFPQADLFCLWNDAPNLVASSNNNYESWLARTQLRKHKALALLTMPAIWRSLRLPSDYDWMLISSHLFAHQAHLNGQADGVKKFVYAHTPARYIWTPELDARGQSLPAKVASSLLKRVDRRSARLNSDVAANSEFVRKRINDTWGLDARVIYPPVDVTKISSQENWADLLSPQEQDVLGNLPADFVLGASRFVPYKRLDLVIGAGEAADIPVVIAGAGPEEQKLRLQASESKVNVNFVINPSDKLLYALYQRTLAFIFPAIEDFGIMPVEAMAAGAPVVVNQQGGASESVLHGRTGFHADFNDVNISQLIIEAAGFEKRDIRRRAECFSEERFAIELRDWITK